MRKLLFLIFFLTLLALAFNFKSKAFAFTCQTTTSSFSCMNALDIFRNGLPAGCSLYTNLGGDCPNQGCSPGNGGSRCVQCTSTIPWNCPDSSCGTGTSCGDNTYYTCGANINQCDGPFTSFNSPACTSTCPTCTQVGGTCTNGGFCPGTQIELNGTCGASNSICCTPPTSTPPPPPPSGCTTSADCGTCSNCCAGNPNYCSIQNFDCAGNVICGAPTPTPAPAYGCTGANNSCVPNPNGIYNTPDCSGACPVPAPGAACNPPNVWKCTGNCSPVNGPTGWTCQDAQGNVCANNGFCQTQPCRPGDTKIDCSNLNYCHVPGTSAIVQ